MGFSFILIFGLLGVIIFVLIRNGMNSVIGENNKLVSLLKKSKLVQHYWLAGIFIFLMNALLFFLTGGLLVVIQYLSIPFIHLLIMFLAVILSVFFWLLVNLSWQGEGSGRLKMGTIGSSFYFFLTIWFIYKYVTLEPKYPGEDTFMASIGLLFGLIVTTVACIACFIFTGIQKGNNRNRFL
ncbi:hypothetical protein [Pseudoneobacillus sp. C159]